MADTLNPWESPRTIMSDEETRNLDASESRYSPHTRLLFLRLLLAIVLGVPGTCLAPFAAWLAVASIGQIVLGTTLLAVPVLLISILALLGLLCLWWFVFFGIQSRPLTIVQVTGIVLGIAILILVVSIQFYGAYR